MSAALARAAQTTSDQTPSTVPGTGPRTAALEDAVLVARAAAGDQAAFGELVRRHLAAAHAAARVILRERADAEDACQDAFLAALTHIEQCRPAHLFRAWLLQIVRRKAIDLHRRRCVRDAAVLGTAPGEVDPPDVRAEAPDARAERGDVRERLTRALDGLTEPQRHVVLLHDVHGWSHGEIARRFGFAEGTSRARLFQARRRLRERLSRDLRALAAFTVPAPPAEPCGS